MNRVLEVKNLEGGYGSVQILHGIDMHVDEGEFVTVIGPNGCGKSTLIKTIFGIATYYAGGIEYRDRDVSGWRTDQLVNHGIAYVPQVDNVFPSLSPWRRTCRWAATLWTLGHSMRESSEPSTCSPTCGTGSTT